MYTQGTDYQTGASTTNYTTQQYQYQYQYQLPTTQTTTTTTQQYTTTTPVTYTTQQFTTTQPVSYTQSYTVPTTDYNQSYTQQQTYTTTATTGVPVYTSGFVKPQPVFKLLRQGSGISPNEQQGIVSTAMAVFQSGITPISNNTASRIKKTLGGDWIVIVYAQGKPVDFNMTCVQGNDYMYFTLDNLAYQVCRLR